MDAHGTFGCFVKATEQPAININHIVRGRGSHAARPVAMVAKAAGVLMLALAGLLALELM